MSSGPACCCPERQKPVSERAWRVMALKCNYSAFNGYRRAVSDYSSIRCGACRASWRTKSNIAYQLKPYVEGEQHEPQQNGARTSPRAQDARSGSDAATQAAQAESGTDQHRTA